MELAKRMPDVIFQVAGAAERISDCPENLQLLGVVSDQRELAERYRKAQLSVLVSERETFSMPCAESLCCGTPVVGFKAGAPEQISLPEYSAFVEFGDISGLAALIRTWLSREGLDRDTIAADAKRAYSSETMVHAFMEVYRRVLWN